MIRDDTLGVPLGWLLPLEVPLEAVAKIPNLFLDWASHASPLWLPFQSSEFEAAVSCFKRERSADATQQHEPRSSQRWCASEVIHLSKYLDQVSFGTNHHFISSIFSSILNSRLRWFYSATLQLPTHCCDGFVQAIFSMFLGSYTVSFSFTGFHKGNRLP